MANEIFDLIRGQEANFPFPVKKRTITVGRFDAATGRFGYSVPTFQEEHDNPLPGKPPIIFEGGTVNAIGAIEVILRFEIINNVSGVTLSIPGLPLARTTTDAVTVSIGAADSVTFTLASARKFTSALPLDIVRFVGGAGVFELAAFPVSIIYAPPPDRDQKNVSRWTVTKTTGNTSSISIANEKTTTRGVTPDFDSVNQIASDMRRAAQALDLVNMAFKNPAVAGISKALNIVAGGLGSVSATETKGTSVTTQHRVTLSTTSEGVIATNPEGGGPGSGDIIHYLKNVKLAWFTSSPGRIRVSIIGHDGIDGVSVGFLKNGGQTGLDPATVAEFLKLDPFVAGGSLTALPPERFVRIDQFGVNNDSQTFTASHSVTQEESSQSITTHTRIQNSKPGFLSSLGLGVTDESSTQTVLRQSSAVQTSDERKVSNTFRFFARPDEFYEVEVFCDVVFGTFAYRLAPSSPTPLLKGTARGKDGKVAAGKIVTLINQGKKFTTRTDSAGRYAFHARAIKPGKFDIRVGLLKRTGTLAAGKTTFNINA